MFLNCLPILLLLVSSSLSSCWSHPACPQLQLWLQSKLDRGAAHQLSSGCCSSAVIRVLLISCHQGGSGSSAVIAVVVFVVQVAEAGVQQLPSVFRMIKQPCPLNEAWSYAYQLHPFPLAMTPFSAEVSHSRVQQSSAGFSRAQQVMAMVWCCSCTHEMT
jgi:hypothetical protein